MYPILFRYLFREIATPFLIGISTFTGVLLMGRMLKLADLVVTKGVPLGDILRLVWYLIPYFCLVTIPMSLLLAVLLAFSRLSSDSELTAMKATGISLYGLLPPVATFALLAFLATTYIALYPFPKGNTEFKKLIYQVIETRVNVGLKEQVFNDDFPGLVIYVDRYHEQDHRMEGILIQDEREAQQPTTIFAQSGTIAADPASKSIHLQLVKGSLHQQLPNRGYRLLEFGQYDLRVDLNKNRRELIKNEQDMTIDELRDNIRLGRFDKKLMIDMGLEIHRRFALPFACFVFALVAIPLGIQNQRSGKAAGFSISIAVLLFYYVFLSATKTLGERELIHPALAVWLPNILFLAGGAFLFRQTAIEHRFLLFDWAADSFTRLAALLSGWRRRE